MHTTTDEPRRVLGMKFKMWMIAIACVVTYGISTGIRAGGDGSTTSSSLSTPSGEVLTLAAQSTWDNLTLGDRADLCVALDNLGDEAMLSSITEGSKDMNVASELFAVVKRECPS